MFSKKVVLALLPVMALTGCSAATVPSATPSPASATACLVVDSRGLADGGVNESAYSAIKESVVSLGTAKFEKVLGAKADSVDAFEAIELMVRRGCNLVITAGPKLRSASIRSAALNPDIAFVLIDDEIPNPEAAPLANNLKHLTFESGQSAVLAGYLAAANSKTGVVATFGSFKTPTVTASMQGFRLGVELFNDETDSDVAVLGAEGKVTEWKYLNNASNPAAGKRAAIKFFDAGADIVYPVAGRAGLGVGEATLERDDTLVIGLDRDWFMDTDHKKWRENVLASTVKQVSRRVLQSIKDFVANGSVGDWTSNSSVGTLANGGVELTDERSIDYSPEFLTARNRIAEQLASGTLETPKGQG